MTDQAQWVPFSDRYGYRTHLDGLGRIFFSCRHTHDDKDGAGWSHCERDQRLRCACPGSPGHPRCCQRASQEDRLCDACRDWCVAIDSAQVYHRFIDLYAAAS